MDISKFLSTTYSFKFTGVEVTVFLLLASLLLILSALYIRRTLSGHIKSQDEIKTGFLGKPLMQFVGVFVMLGAIGGAVYLSQKPKDFVTQAGKQLEIRVDYTKQAIEQCETRVTLSTTPIVDSIAWGEDNESFDIIWDIKTQNGLINSSKKTLVLTEISKTSANAGSISFIGRPGIYHIKVIVTTESGSYDHELTVNI